LLGEAMRELKRPPGEVLSKEHRGQLTSRLTELDLQLQPLIEEAHTFKKEAQALKMKVLEQNAESLSQSLTAVRQKLFAFTQPIQ
jgi:HPt (histidine-containing phosphotransfer) domain-containing protein